LQSATLTSDAKVSRTNVAIFLRRSALGEYHAISPILPLDDLAIFPSTSGTAPILSFPKNRSVLVDLEIGCDFRQDGFSFAVTTPNWAFFSPCLSFFSY